jgi:hypothetical protein
VDEKKLGELFKDAVGDPPPATFGTGDVRKASHRATARRRNGIVAGSALAVVLLGGGVVTTVALTGENTPTSALAPAAPNSEGAANGGTMYDNGGAGSAHVEQAQPPTLNDRSDGSKQGDPSTGKAGGSAGSTLSGCEKADRELAAALASELPAAPNPDDALAVPFSCPSGSRGAAFKVTDAARPGTISVVLIPKGVSPGIAQLGINVPGTANFTAPAVRTGGTLVLVSQPTPELAEPPYSETASRMAIAIGENF